MNNIKIGKLLLFFLFLKLKAALPIKGLEILSNFNGFDLKKSECKKALPERYHELFNIYFAIKHSTEHKNSAGLLQFFMHLKINNVCNDIQNKILYMIPGNYFVFSKIDYGTPIHFGYCDEFKHFTIDEMREYQGKISAVTDLKIQPHINSSVIEIIDEICLSDINNENKNRAMITEQFKEYLSRIFCIEIKNKGLYLEKKNNTWNVIKKKLTKYLNKDKHKEKLFSLVEKVNTAEKNSIDNIIVDRKEELLFIENIIYISVHFPTYCNFLKKTCHYYVDIKLISPGLSYCKTASVIKVLNIISQKTYDLKFNAIVLKAFVSNDGVLAVELIDETIYEDENFTRHFENAPNPTYHEIRLYDLYTNTLLNIIKLPLPEKYAFNLYRFSLLNIRGNKVYIKDLVDENIIVTFNDQTNLDVGHDTKISDSLENTNLDVGHNTKINDSLENTNLDVVHDTNISDSLENTNLDVGHDTNISDSKVTQPSKRRPA